MADDTTKVEDLSKKEKMEEYKGASALIQIFLNFNNKFCPRDAKDQIKYFKKNIKLKDIKKNDIIYWKGHVALALSNKKLIHAYGPMKKTVIMGIDQTIKKIKNTANLKVIGVKQGDEVITAANTFVATVGAICELGAKPIFVDCDDSFCMNVDLIESKISPKTKAIVPVHFTGYMTNMPKLLKIAKKL